MSNLVIKPGFVVQVELVIRLLITHSLESDWLLSVAMGPQLDAVVTASNRNTQKYTSLSVYEVC